MYCMNASPLFFADSLTQPLAQRHLKLLLRFTDLKYNGQLHKTRSSGILQETHDSRDRLKTDRGGF